jgi:hypothetical protein
MKANSADRAAFRGLALARRRRIGFADMRSTAGDIQQQEFKLEGAGPDGREGA